MAGHIRPGLAERRVFWKGLRSRSQSVQRDSTPLVFAIHTATSLASRSNCDPDWYSANSGEIARWLAVKARHPCRSRPLGRSLLMDRSYCHDLGGSLTMVNQNASIDCTILINCSKSTGLQI